MEKKTGRFKKIFGGAVLAVMLTISCCVMFQREGDFGFGPFSGVVLDAETREPIEGAQVYLRIRIKVERLVNTRAYHHREFDQTNRKGKYRIGKYVFLRGLPSYSSYEIRIYKAGYVCYRNDLIFKAPEGTSGARKDFKIRKNVVLLERWDDTKYTPKDHSDHVDFMGISIGCPKGKGGIRFCEEAREEMILDCMAIWARYPKTRKQCERIIDRRIYGTK